MTANEHEQVQTAIHMLKCQIAAIRYGIICDKPDMIVDAVNEMEKTLVNLEKTTKTP
jgi:hypothetical protein